MQTVKVLALVNTLGLYPGDQVEIDREPVVEELLRAGLLVELRLRHGQDVPE